MGRLNFTNNNGTTLNFEGSNSEKSALEFMYDTAEYKEFAQQGIDVGIGINNKSKLDFISDYEIVVELKGSVEAGDNFMLIDGETAGAIAVADAFTKGENIKVKLNGNELNTDDWDFVFFKRRPQHNHASDYSRTRRIRRGRRRAITRPRRGAQEKSLIFERPPPACIS